MNGVYIHIPFCKSKCPYCSFYSEICGNDFKHLYSNAVINEITTLRRCSQYMGDTPFYADTLYLGGGTPSVLSGEDIKKIVLSAKDKFHIPKDGEITIECNPSSPIEELIPYFKACGINRVSLGMQSAVEGERKELGRNSDRDRIKFIVEKLKANEINNISLDVMLGIPNQTKATLEETLDFICECDIPHISAYILKIEEGTFFHTHKERYSFPTDDEAADLYEFCCDYLGKKGYIHYEISNFAKEGYYSRHNSKYWSLENYLGIGASAHSYINGKRFYFPDDSRGFIDGAIPESDGNGGDAEEYVMLRLRLKEGLNLTELQTLYGIEFRRKVQKKIPLFEKQGLVASDGESISLTDKGMLLSNYIICEFIY